MPKTTKSKRKAPWNKGRTVGKKPPLKLDQVRAIKFRLEQDGHIGQLAMFCLAIDSKLRESDLLSLKVEDIADANGIKPRVSMRQKKTADPVIFEISPETAKRLDAWIEQENKFSYHYLFTGQKNPHKPISTRYYLTLVKKWVALIGLDPANYGTHSLRRTKVAHIYQRTGNLRAAQLLLGHKHVSTTAEYLGVEQDDALAIAEAYEM